MSVYPYVCPLPSISEETVCRIFMKFSTGVIYNRVSRKGEFRENRITDPYTLLRDVNAFLGLLSIFLDQLGCSWV
jgi:hypothetical protein